VAYSALSLPPPRLAPTPILPMLTITQVPIADTALHGELVMKSVWQRVFRRGKQKKVQTLERPPETEKKKDPVRLYRVMYHNSEYMPDRVARVLAKVFPTLDRRAAFELCTNARSVGKVAVVITGKKQAETYCMALLRQGLTATVEPHVDVK
jgi:ATP-dependent Clp protease adapter protein ClpS